MAARFERNIQRRTASIFSCLRQRETFCVGSAARGGRSGALFAFTINNNRSDRTQYFPQHQQTPAVYTIASLYRIVTYDGAAPFTNAPERQILQAARPWAVWQPTERWAALVDETGWGVGVYSPETPELGGGYYMGTSGRTSDDACGALFYNTMDVLDCNMVYDYEFWIVVGDVPTIRSWVYRNRKPAQEPIWQFDRDRRHWWFMDLTDQGWPISGSLKLILDQNDPQLFGPFGLWQAADIPKLYIRAAYRTKSSTTAQVYFSNLGDAGFTGPKAVSFQIIPDGQIRTYEVNLAASPLYTGTITQFRFDPVYTGGPGETMDLYYISYKKIE